MFPWPAAIYAGVPCHMSVSVEALGELQLLIAAQCAETMVEARLRSVRVSRQRPLTPS